jgi:hypothetical protein
LRIDTLSAGCATRSASAARVKLRRRAIVAT